MVAGVFSFATATAKDIQTVMITRFFSGFCAAASISNTGAVMSDMWSIEQRAVSVAGYALAVVAGPTLGPIVGGAICHSSLGWRWTEYVGVPLYSVSRKIRVACLLALRKFAKIRSMYLYSRSQASTCCSSRPSTSSSSTNRTTRYSSYPKPAVSATRAATGLCTLAMRSARSPYKRWAVHI